MISELEEKGFRDYCGSDKLPVIKEKCAEIDLDNISIF